jgi:hypothetical protein
VRFRRRVERHRYQGSVIETDARGSGDGGLVAR